MFEQVAGDSWTFRKRLFVGVGYRCSADICQLNTSELTKAGVREDLVRLSIALDHIEDMVAELEQALAKVSIGAGPCT